MVIEGCFLDSILSVCVFLDVFFDGILDEELFVLFVLGNVFDFMVSYVFLIGVYRLEFCVMDGCGNLRSVLLLFEVCDCYVLDLICLNGYVVNFGFVLVGVDNNGDGEDDEVGVVI